MKISSIKFVKGIVGEDPLFLDGKPQIAFIGRSNVGKSSLINTLTNSKISKTSSNPGSTQQINIFLINDSFYLVDLPGYGFARASGMGREKIGNLIEMYLFNEKFTPTKVVLIIDANVGMTEKDISMFEELRDAQRNFIIAPSKIDKLTQSEKHKNLNEIKKRAGDITMLPFSSKKKTGLDALALEIFAL